MKIHFDRFVLLLFVLIISPWNYFYGVPLLTHLPDWISSAEVPVVTLFNDQLLHVKTTLNMDGGGSGDTSYAWAQFHTFLILSVAGTIAWSLARRNKPESHPRAAFWLRNLVRYHVAAVSFSYGIIKLFALQMPFPDLSQLSTPLGDFLPMRLSWMFIGYSAPYQIFSGAAEVITGLLLLNRRTVLAGALLGIGVFTNVFMLNIAYDVPVKLYSMQLLMCCLFLAGSDWKRLMEFFWQNQGAARCGLYDLSLDSRWKKIGRLTAKGVFILMIVVLPIHDSWGRYQEVADKKDLKPVKSGVYEIMTFIRNGDTLSTGSDEVRWKDIIFDKGGVGSVNSADTLFRQRYRRGYFVYTPDTVKETIAFKKFATDTLNLFEWKYRISDETGIELWGTLRADSLRLILKRTNRHFQLAERQFHWISEANR